MSDASSRSNGSPTLWGSIALFALFGVQLVYQVWHANRLSLDVNVDLRAELAEATILEDDPAPASADWPQWRGPQRDGIAHAPDLLTDWPDDGPPQLWQTRVGLGYSSFAVHEDRLYSLFQEGEREVVACWGVADGKERWRHAYDCRYTPKDYPGPRSTPTLDGDRLYTLGSAGKFLCLDAATGSPHWEKDLPADFHAPVPRWGFAFSPLIDGDLVYTTPGGPDGNSLAAFDKYTGELAWKGLDAPAGYSSPVAATLGGTRQIIFFLGDRIVGVTVRDGKPCWTYSWPTTYDVNAATPLVFQARKGAQILDYVFISSGYGKGCVLLKIASLGGGRFEARKVYQGHQMSSHFASPVRRGAYLYGIDDSRLVCLDLRSGELMWTRAGVNKGSLLRVDDWLLVLAENGRLSLFAASPVEGEAQAETRPFRGRCWTMPVLADGRLYLRDEQQIRCFDLRKK